MAVRGQQVFNTISGVASGGWFPAGDALVSAVIIPDTGFNATLKITSGYAGAHDAAEDVDEIAGITTPGRYLIWGPAAEVGIEATAHVAGDIVAYFYVVQPGSME
jgi:predicted membrane protein